LEVLTVAHRHICTTDLSSDLREIDETLASFTKHADEPPATIFTTPTNDSPKHPSPLMKI